MKFSFSKYLFILFLVACTSEENTSDMGDQSLPYTVSGRVTSRVGAGIEGVQIFYSPSSSVITDQQGYWTITGLKGAVFLTPKLKDYSFTPLTFKVEEAAEGITFSGSRILSDLETKIYTWFDRQQLSNGLLESAENGNVVSLYDNALAAMVFMLKGDFPKAEKIFNFFNARVGNELTSGVGGFAQLRDRNGIPNNHRWMGDNAWLLIALNNYKNLTGSTIYDQMASALSQWLMRLQDADGGLFAGYNSGNVLMNYKVTEGNIDAFNAIAGYTSFHRQLLSFLEKDRWDKTDKNLVAWPGNPPYWYALDLHPWSYLIFPYYPVSALTTDKRFLTTQTATNEKQITGYTSDQYKNTIWPEGTGQMATAFCYAGLHEQKERYLKEMENVLIHSTTHPDGVGFPYASNRGTGYGSDILWNGADTKIAISGGAWYLFARSDFNPFYAGRNKNIPVSDMFWVR